LGSSKQLGPSLACIFRAMAGKGNDLQNALQSLKQSDPQISEIVAFSKFVVAYLLQQDGDSPGWRKANIEGPVYVVHRRQAPWYQLIVKNQFSAQDLQDDLHASWELDCQKNYIFYKVEDEKKSVRGLWFHEDQERSKFEASLEKVLAEIRTNPGGGGGGEPQPEPSRPEKVREVGHQQAGPQAGFGAGQNMPKAGAQQQQVSRNAPKGQVQVTQQGLSAALHSLADDPNFLSMVMQKLSQQQTNQNW